MLDKYKILTLTFHESRVDQLADYFIEAKDDAEEHAMLKSLKEKLEVEEFMYLSTCNRVFFLFYTHQSEDQLRNGLARVLGKKDSLPALLFYSGEGAVRHFFEVTASLNSMVVGEHEILRQVREAYEKSRERGLTGDHIRILFQSGLQSAKAVHSGTRISEKVVSVVSLAMRQLRRLGLNPDDDIILVGAGESMRTVAKFLAEWKVRSVKIFNRSIENLEVIRKILPQAQTYLLDELVHHNLNVGFIITCTGSQDYVLTPELIAQSQNPRQMESNRGILDLAVPNDVHPGVVTKYGVKLIEIESLRTIAEKNMGFRMKEASKAKGIIEDQIAEFRERVHRRFIEKAFQDIPAQIYATRDRAMQTIFHDRIAQLDENAQTLLTEMMEYMTNRCISIPMQTAREQYTAIRHEIYKEKKRQLENRR